MDNDLKNSFNDWIDWDIAAFKLAIQIGMLHNEHDKFHKLKHLFWTDNEVGNSLHEMLNQLAQCGFLEKREEPDIQFRWNKNFIINPPS